MKKITNIVTLLQALPSLFGLLRAELETSLSTYSRVDLPKEVSPKNNPLTPKLAQAFVDPHVITRNGKAHLFSGHDFMFEDFTSHEPSTAPDHTR